MSELWIYTRIITTFGGRIAAVSSLKYANFNQNRIRITTRILLYSPAHPPTHPQVHVPTYYRISGLVRLCIASTSKCIWRASPAIELRCGCVGGAMGKRDESKKYAKRLMGRGLRRNVKVHKHNLNTGIRRLSGADRHSLRVRRQRVCHRVGIIPW